MKLVSEDLNQYCEEHSSVPSPICQEIAEYTRANVPMSTMLTGPLEGSFLGLLVGITGARRVLEIGTFTGYSALAMAERLAGKGEVVTLDRNLETTALARGFWQKSPHGKKITSIHGPALESLEEVKGPFDLIFIDADKVNYLAYFKKSLTLLSPRGVILVDNVLWSGKVVDTSIRDEETEAIRRLNEYVKSRQELESTLLPIRDGVYVIRKRG